LPKEALPDRNNAPPAPRGSVTYGYDNASQLTGLTYKNGSTTLGNLTYSYDLAGRRINTGGSYARTGTPQAAPSASYNVNNQLTQWKGASLTYDANGNLTSDGTNTYNWNARNQLVSISGGASASFQYDPFGRRVSKTIGGTTQYLYDGANPVQEISGTTASANLLTGGVDEYFQRTDSAGARSFLTDALGGTLALADSTGTLQTQYTFEPFGNTSVTGTATTNSFAYTGRELDATGLYFYRARYYSPTLQRFISEDPIRLGGGMNLYAFVHENPTSNADPMGLDSGPENLGLGFTGRVDRWGGGQDFEIHVYDPSGNEVGIVSGANRWIGKHGFPDNEVPPGIPNDVINKLNGLNVNELRAAGELPPGNIRRGNYLNPGRTLFPALMWLPGILGEILDYRDLKTRGRKNGLSVDEERCREARQAGHPGIWMDPMAGPVPIPCRAPWEMADGHDVDHSVATEALYKTPEEHRYIDDAECMIEGRSWVFLLTDGIHFVTGETA
jgi:RHS repeat-associated protein